MDHKGWQSALLICYNSKYISLFNSFRCLILFRRLVSVITVVVFLQSSIAPGYTHLLDAAAPAAGILTLTPLFQPVSLEGVRVYPDNPFKFDFLIDTGDVTLDVNSRDFKSETENLIKYFLASTTIPENELWVNLSPTDKDRIMPEGLARTEMGKDMLAQDYILKQLTSSLMFPDSALGKAFWERIYDKVQQTFGTTDIPAETFNKVWIVPDKAVIYEKENTAYISESHLKVMLDVDYAARKSLNNSSEQGEGVLIISQQIIREILLPELEKEVNEGKTFAKLRQIYGAMLLATWFKINIENSPLGQAYANKNKTMGVASADRTFRQKIYGQYIESFKNGVFNYIRDENDPQTGHAIPRKYFSGGIEGFKRSQLVVKSGAAPQEVSQRRHGRRVIVDAAMQKMPGNAAESSLERPGIDATDEQIRQYIARHTQSDPHSAIVSKLTHVEIVRRGFLNGQHARYGKDQGSILSPWSQAPPKIAEIHFSYPPHVWGGVNIIMVEQVKWLLKQGFSVKVISGSPADPNPQENLESVCIKELNQLNKNDPIVTNANEGRIIPEYKDLEELIYTRLKEQITDRDIIIVHNVWTVRDNLPFTFALRRIVQDSPLKQFVIYMHNTEDHINTQYPLSMLNPAIDFPNVKYITVCEAYRDHISRIYGLPSSDIGILNPGVHPYSPLDMTSKAVEDFRKNGLLDAQNPVITMAFPTRLDWNKDIEKSLLFLKSLSGKLEKEIKLIIAIPDINSFDALIDAVRVKLGDNVADKLEALRSVEKDIVFLNTAELTDFPSHRQYILDIMALSDFLVYPTIMETFGMFVIEASASGTDIIATDMPSHRESVGDHALLFDIYGPVDSTVNAIIERIALYPGQQQKRNSFQEKTLIRYSWDNLMRSQLAPLLHDTFNKRPLLSNAVAIAGNERIQAAYEVVMAALHAAADVPSAAPAALDNISGGIDVIRKHQSLTHAFPVYIYDAMISSLHAYARSGASEKGRLTLKTAVAAIDQLLKDTHNTISLNQLGHFFRTEGLFHNAKHAYEEVLKIDNRNTEALNGLALAHLDMHEPENARSIFGKILEIDPRNQDAQRELDILASSDMHVMSGRNVAPDVEKIFTHRDTANRVVRFTSHNVSAHIALSNTPKPVQDIIIATPNKSNENVFYWKTFSGAGDFLWILGEVTPVVGPDQFKGVDIDLTANTSSIFLDSRPGQLHSE